MFRLSLMLFDLLCHPLCSCIRRLFRQGSYNQLVMIRIVCVVLMCVNYIFILYVRKFK